MTRIAKPAAGSAKDLPTAKSPAVRLLVATGLAVAVWMIARVALHEIFPFYHSTYLLATVAVLISASVAGPSAGLLTTAMLAPVAFLVLDDPDSLPLRAERWQDAANTTLFVIIGSAISLLAGREAAAKRIARENGERFRQILEQGPLGIAIVGRDHRVQDANSMFSRMLGLEPGELAGRTIESLTYPDDRAKSTAMLSRLWADDLPSGYTLTKRYARKTGETFWATLSVAAVRDERGEPVYVVGMVQDISDRKRMEEDIQRSKEQAEAASRAKDQFIAVLSHELRTPLSPVLLTASSLEADPSLPGTLRDGIHTIRQNVELEARLIDDLLDITGIAQGKLSLRRTRVDAQALLGQAMYMVERDIRDKGLRIRTELTAPCADVDADPTRLQQVFWNLLKNAVKFTPPDGEIVVRTRCETTAAKEWLVVEVQDSGAGIAPDLLPRLFNPFEQGPSKVARQFGGLGLGLAISRSIVELHGGRIEAESPGPGQGATFRVRLPRAAAAATAAAAADSPPLAETTAEGETRPRQSPPAPAAAPTTIPCLRLRILLVEDHAPTRRAMSAILASLGHQVRPTGTLAEAIAAAESHPFDLIVSDLALPDGSGHDLMRRLKSTHHDLHGVAISGFGMAEDVRRSREAGFDEHLTKPLSREQIQEALSHIVGSAMPPSGALA